MNSKNENKLNFPVEIIESQEAAPGSLTKKEKDYIEVIKRFYKISEKINDNEWNQEYFLIYNSYVLENT